MDMEYYGIHELLKKTKNNPYALPVFRHTAGERDFAGNVQNRCSFP